MGVDSYPPGSGMAETMLTFSDVTTNNATTSAHGFLKKLDNDATHYMSGTGVWTQPYGVQNPLMITGSWYDIADFWGGARLLLTAGASSAADRVYLFPFVCRQTVTVTKFAFNVTTAAGASNARCGFYADSAGLPSGAALVDSGNMSTASTGSVESSAVSYQLVANTAYWWAVHTSGIIALNGYNGTWVPCVGASSASDATQYNCYRMTNSFGALPTIGSLTRVQMTAPWRLQVLV